MVSPNKNVLPMHGNSKQDENYSVSYIFSIVSFYWIVSLSIVFLNKIIFSGSETKFPYPLFVTWYQLLVALVLLIVCGELGKRIRLFSMVPPFEFHLDLAKTILPLTIIYIGMLSFNNLCLKYVEVTFYQVARSLSIFFNIVFTYLLLGKTTSTNAILACVVIFLGFIIGSYGEINFSWEGIIYGVCSSCFVALYGIYVKKNLSVVDGNEWRLIHYNTAMASMLIIPLIWFGGEFEFINDPEVQHIIYDSNFWMLMTVTAICGFLINVAMFLQIKVTTALTNTISGTAKSCVQTLLGWLIFRNEISPLNGFGIFLSLLGSGWYSVVRYMEMQQPQK